MKLLAFFFDVFGRTRRRDFWLFNVCLFAFYSLMLGGGGMAHNRISYQDMPLTIVQTLVSNDYGFIVFAVLQVVTLVVLVRRCHDRGLSGFWLLAGLVPVLGWLWLFIELGLKPGDEEGNAYGPSPKSGYRTL